MKSKNYIFKEEDEKLIFVGDFDGFYHDCDDPWEQSGQGQMSEYYSTSRARTLSIISKVKHSDIFDVGCGLGYTTALFKKKFNTANVTGVDISKSAITKAKKLFPDLNFIVADISNKDCLTTIKSNTDVIILNQLLWYILPELEQVFNNIHHILSQHGCLIISNAFAREQKYGREIINGYSGAAEFFDQLKQFKLLEAHFFDDDFEHCDGHFLLTKTK